MQTFSYSKVTAFKNCPKAYEFRYVLGESERFSTIERHMGSSVHEALRWAYAERREERSPMAEEIVARFEESWASAELSRAVVVKPGITADDYRLDGRRMVERYARDEFPRDRSETLGLECRFRTRLSNGVEFTGIIDRISRLPEGILRITDYKTGSRVPNPLSDPQLVYYASCVFESYPDDRIELCFLDLRNGRPLAAEFHRGAIVPYMESLVEEIGRITCTERFEPIPSALCKWCGFNPICDAADASVRTVAVRSSGSSEPGQPSEVCPECGSRLVDRNGKYGGFVGCTGYPGCRYTRDDW